MTLTDDEKRIIREYDDARKQQNRAYQAYSLSKYPASEYWREKQRVYDMALDAVSPKYHAILREKPDETYEYLLFLTGQVQIVKVKDYVDDGEAMPELHKPKISKIDIALIMATVFCVVYFIGKMVV